MPFGQFNETRGFNHAAHFTDAYVLATVLTIGGLPTDQTLRLDVLQARNSDVVAHTLRVHSDNAGFTLADVIIPAQAGYAGNPSVDLLTGWGLTGQQAFILLTGGDSLDFELLAVPGAGAFIDVTAFGGSFPANL